VDDDVDARLITQQILEPLGARVLVASDGPEALRLVDRVIPDVILCDLLMPDMDGFEVARRLRRDPRTARLPIIAVTALDRDPDYYRTWEAGFDGHLSKPVDYAELAWIVRMLTRRRRGRRGGAWWGVGSAAGTRRVPRGRPASPPR
jgi:CheY-like chemotaxis protein